MRLWILSRLDTVPQYDVTNAVVVRAHSEARARELAARVAGDEGAQVWIHEDESSCGELTADGVEAIIIRDFAAG